MEEKVCLILNNMTEEIFLRTNLPFLWYTIWALWDKCGASGKDPTCQCRRCGKHGLLPCFRKIPWRRKWQPTPIFVPGEFHGQRSLAGYSPYDHTKLDGVKWFSTAHGWKTEDQHLAICPLLSVRPLIF